MWIGYQIPLKRKCEKYVCAKYQCKAQSHCQCVCLKSRHAFYLTKRVSSKCITTLCSMRHKQVGIQQQMLHLYQIALLVIQWLSCLIYPSSIRPHNDCRNQFSAFIALHCIALCCISFYCIVLYCIVQHCIVLYCVVLNCIVLYCVVLCCVVLYCIVLNCCVGLPTL